jgi:lysozyme family protein
MSFQKFLNLLPVLEGGSWDDPNIGPTAALGITEVEWRKTHSTWPPSPTERASWIMDTYWLPYRCGDLPEPADSVFGQIVYNLPSDRRIKLLQAVVGAYPDGKWGPETISGVRAVGKDLADLLLAGQGVHYLERSSSDLLEGLMNRIAKVKAAIATGQI